MSWTGQIPVILLENPKYPGNIGMVCRLIANFGLPPLRIIGDPVDFHFEMEWMAYNSSEELDKIQYYPDFVEATSDLEVVVGTGMIHGSDRGRFISLNELPSTFGDKKAGILFGREDTGLTRSAVIQCDCMIDFRLPGYQKSMNLSHSVSYVLSTLYNHKYQPKPNKEPVNSPSDKKHFYEFTTGVFKKLGMNQFHGNEFLPVKRLKQIVERSNPSHGDVAFLYKLFKKIDQSIDRLDSE